MEFYYYMDYTRARELASGALAAYARLEPRRKRAGL